MPSVRIHYRRPQVALTNGCETYVKPFLLLVFSCLLMQTNPRPWPLVLTFTALAGHPQPFQLRFAPLFFRFFAMTFSSTTCCR